MVTSTQISQTEYYKKLDNVKQIIIKKKASIMKIELGINMSRLKGFDFWVKTTKPRNHVKCIVEELIK